MVRVSGATRDPHALVIQLVPFTLALTAVRARCAAIRRRQRHRAAIPTSVVRSPWNPTTDTWSQDSQEASSTRLSARAHAANPDAINYLDSAINDYDGVGTNTSTTATIATNNNNHKTAPSIAVRQFTPTPSEADDSTPNCCLRNGTPRMGERHRCTPDRTTRALP